ncbi:PleD family two-component system response regulator, partial [Candidatus Omnitrophota bacterium]
ILLDIMMPDIDGFEVLNRLRNDPCTAFTNIIMCTAKGDTSSILKAEKSYATDYIIKPFELSELMGLIKKYI